jgi:5-oxopent-3-ene-1,2,5-tricarboxylate decarboxylase / 2-hydroxyhepta-2,4-diene-1,7-dioate isomerase
MDTIRETRRILLGGATVEVQRHGATLRSEDGRTVSVTDAIHLPPVLPTKILCVHLNHSSRVREFEAKLPPAPTYFHKPVSALNSHLGEVVRPVNCKYLNYEGEVAIVIGRRCRNVSYADAPSYIGGYTIANDYGLHDFRDADSGSMLRVKGADTLCPIGPGYVRGWDPAGKAIRTYVNGILRQDGTTNEMAWDMAYLVADLARLITLEPGDIILSGTPAVSRPVQPGDVVTVEVEGLGELTNTIVQGPVPVSDEIGAQPTETEEVRSTALGSDWELRGQRAPVYPTPRDLLPSPRIRPRTESSRG